MIQQANNSYHVYPVPQADMARQEEDYARLLEGLGQATFRPANRMIKRSNANSENVPTEGWFNLRD